MYLCISKCVCSVGGQSYFKNNQFIANIYVQWQEWKQSRLWTDDDIICDAKWRSLPESYQRVYEWIFAIKILLPALNSTLYVQMSNHFQNRIQFIILNFFHEVISSPSCRNAIKFWLLCINYYMLICLGSEMFCLGDWFLLIFLKIYAHRNTI